MFSSTGASGAIGSRLVPQLIDAGHEVVGTSQLAGERRTAAGARRKAGRARSARRRRGAQGRAREPSPRRSCTRRPRWRTWVQPQLRQDSARTNGCGPRAPTCCSRPRARPACADSSRRASPARPVRARGRAGQDRGRSARPAPAGEHAASPAPPWTISSERSREFGGIALRYGVFYGAANDGTIEPVRKRQFPIIGDGGGVWSWIHLDDAAAATVLALEHDGAGDLQHRRRRARPGARVAAGARGGARREAAAARSRSGSRGWSRARRRW